MSENPLTRAHNIILSILRDPEKAKSKNWIEDATEVITKDKGKWPILKWRMGPVPEGLQGKEYLIRNINLCGGYRHRVGRGHSLTYGEEYIPLSEILALVEEE
jgi:hypothetical protein